MNRRTLFLTVVLLAAALLQGCALPKSINDRLVSPVRDRVNYVKVLASWPGGAGSWGGADRYCNKFPGVPACADRDGYDFVYLVYRETWATYIRGFMWAPKSAAVKPGDIITVRVGKDEGTPLMFLRLVRKEADRGEDCDWKGSRWLGSPESVECEGWTYDNRADASGASAAH